MVGIDLDTKRENTKITLDIGVIKISWIHKGSEEIVGSRTNKYIVITIGMTAYFSSIFVLDYLNISNMFTMTNSILSILTGLLIGFLAKWYVQYNNILKKQKEIEQELEKY